MKRQLSNKSWSSLITILAISFVALFAIGCGSEAPAEPEIEPTPIPPTPTPDPAELVRAAGAAMTSLDSVQFSMERSGGPAFVDADGLFAINTATGAYAAPKSIAAAVDVAGPGLNVKVETIAIGEQQWLTNFLTQQWEKLPEGFGFNPAIIFSANEGLEAIFNDNLVSASNPRSESLDGTSYQLFDIEIEGDRVSAITAGTSVSDAPVPLQIWVDPSTNYIHRMVFETPSTGDEPSQWTLNFSGFNEPITIEPPQ